MPYFSPPNRTLCDTLEEMRTCIKTLNFALLASLIEEAQCYGNRMESALYDQKDFEYGEKEYKKLKIKIKEAEEKLDND